MPSEKNKKPWHRNIDAILAEKKSSQTANALIHTQSPYLLQHAHNPVQWRSWGDKALTEAKELNRPILLSIGYATCHWCHVMEQESFENPDIADLMNRLYVPIKVDREQRPDLDQHFMQVVQAMTGRGGWPMTLWLTPDRTPFFGGTYFPPNDGERGVRWGFATLLEKLSQAFEAEHERIEEEGRRYLEAKKHQEATIRRESTSTLDLESMTASAFEALRDSFDAHHGGFGAAPKFPQPSVLSFLHRYGACFDQPLASEMVDVTLRHILAGGIFDHIGGGLHRYAVDHWWGVPHFEKMLYDNGQLLKLLARVHASRPSQAWVYGLEKTASYLLQDMIDDTGLFYAAMDADSEGREGAYYTWTIGEMRQHLGGESEAMETLFGATDEGNFDGRNVLHMTSVAEGVQSLEVVVNELSQPPFVKSIETMKAQRLQRVPPLTDDKHILSWHAQALEGLFWAGWVLDRKDWMDAGSRAFDSMVSEFWAEDDAHHMRRKGLSDELGFLDDWANAISSALSLFQMTGRPRYAESAQTWLGEVIKRFYDVQEGAFWYVEPKRLETSLGDKPFNDGAEASGNAIMLDNLTRMGALGLLNSHDDVFVRTLDYLSKTMSTHPLGLSKSLDSLMGRDAKGKVTLLLKRPGAKGDALLGALRQYLERVGAWVVADLDSMSPEERVRLGETIPMFQGKINASSDASELIICDMDRCLPPMELPSEVEAFFQEA